MSRVTMLRPDEFAPELLELVGPIGSEDGAELGSFRAWAQRPDLARAMFAFKTALAQSAVLPPRLVELVRLRVAFHNQCRSCMVSRSEAAIEDGMTEELVCELARPAEAPDLTERERVALDYADRLSVAHHTIDDGTFERLGEHFTQGEIIELGAHIGFFIGFGRVGASWDLVDDLPESLRRDGVVGPWDTSEVVRR